CVLLSPGTGFPCSKPPPLRMAFIEILPNGPASNVAGGNPDSGPVMAGCESGAGGVGVAGASCALHKGAAARQSTKVPIYTKCCSFITISFSSQDSRQKKTPRSTNHGVQLDDVV